MSAEIVDLAAHRRQRLVRVVRRPAVDASGLVLPAAMLAGLALWTAILVSTLALAAHQGRVGR